MTNEEKIALIEDVMDLDKGTLSPDSTLADYDEWDSLSKLALIAMAKKRFSVSLTAEEIKSFITVNDILACLV